ncbi:MAG: hypothetical protein H7122_20440 [Chitinophagaceae bacterium]|nr:hypothetical protein [Chitinophagaceae bacterium]
MKQIFALACVLIAACTYAQDCKNYYYLQNNKTVEMSIYDKKGDVNGRLVYTISGVTNSGGLTTANVQSQMFDKKGKTLAKASSVMKCNGGIMMINMKMTMPIPQTEQSSQANVKAEEFYLEYPVNMGKGDELKEGTLSMDMENNGIPQSVNMTIFDRKVEDKEKITTTAGSWDCYKISYKSKMSIKMMGVGVPVNMEGTEWYAPGFGVVKTLNKHGGTEITSIK